MWRERKGLVIRGGRLLVAGRDAEGLGRESGTPSYVFDLSRIGEQVHALRTAFDRVGLQFRYRYALKANREPEDLRYLRSLGDVGIDVCSCRSRRRLALQVIDDEIGGLFRQRRTDILVPCAGAGVAVMSRR